MHRLLKNIAAAVKRHFGRPAPRPRDRRVRPRLEALEDRRLLAVTDMTALAALFPTKPVQTLYLNFEGFNTGYFTTQPFQSTTGNPADRDRDIHDVLFRTSEIFAPFGVRVMRVMWGYGGDGTTTVFIGDRGAGTPAGAATPFDFTDFPGPLRGEDHVPNSDPYDLAYVDPIRANGTSWSSLQIASGIAHEAGHTFGLGHVRTVGTDPASLTSFDGPGTVPEMMSYDSTNQRFRNQTFSITQFNFNGTSTTMDPLMQPKWDGSVITTQNSFTYLQTRLGARGMDDHANVSHADVVDSAYADKAKTNLAVGSTFYGNIHLGDYDVFRFTAAVNQTLIVSASATITSVGSSGLNPVLLVYSAPTWVSKADSGNLVAFNNDLSATDTNSRLTYWFQAGKTYHLVVGGANSSSISAYKLRLDANTLPPGTMLTPSSMTASPGSMAVPSAAASAPSAGASPDLGVAQAPQLASVTTVSAVYPGRAAAVESIRPGAARAVDALFAAQRSSIRPKTTLPTLGSIRPSAAALDAAWRDGWQPLALANVIPWF